ncbi:hypothetical protein [Chimaeribacter coloradensis]|nr:hypothetical protein [Chimaeribacter coloradensis]
MAMETPVSLFIVFISFQDISACYHSGAADAVAPLLFISLPFPLLFYY